MSANYPPNTNPNNRVASATPRVVYRADEHDVDWFPDVDTPAGTVVVFANGIGVTKVDCKAEELAALHVDGQFDFPKVLATEFAFGDPLMWSATTEAADGQQGAMIASDGSTVHAYCTTAGGADASYSVVRARLNR